MRREDYRFYRMPLHRPVLFYTDEGTSVRQVDVNIASGNKLHKCAIECMNVTSAVINAN